MMVYEIVCVDPSKGIYELRYLLNTNDKIIGFKIKNNRDVQYMLREESEILKVFMTVQHS